MAQTRKSVSYCDFINFKDSEASNPQKKLCEASQKVKRFSKGKKTQKLYFEHIPSSLEETALLKIRYDRLKKQKEELCDILSQSSSNYFLSRENTPANYSIPKKKLKNRTACSDLYDVESKGSYAKREQDALFDGLIIQPRLVGLTDIVYSEVMGKEKKINPKLIHNWKDCLLPEDKQEIFGSKAPYSFSRIFPINELEKGFTEIYGEGKKRCLRVGEESILIYNMEKYLEKCSKDVMKIARKDFDIIGSILKSAKLEELEQLPICMKQIELMWRILATQWRYSGQLDLTNKLLESAFINGRSNFLDLRKTNAVNLWLLESSNYANRQYQK